LYKTSWIGDILLSTIVLENLKLHSPTPKFIISPKNLQGVLLKTIHSFKNFNIHKKDFVLSIIRKVRKEKYDLVFDFWSNPKTAQITFFQALNTELVMKNEEESMLTTILAKMGQWVNMLQRIILFC